MVRRTLTLVAMIFALTAAGLPGVAATEPSSDCFEVEEIYESSESWFMHWSSGHPYDRESDDYGMTRFWVYLPPTPRNAWGSTIIEGKGSCRLDRVMECGESLFVHPEDFVNCVAT